MGLFGASFQIGHSALAAYQTAVTVTGQNIANVGNADYTRQSARLAAMHGGMTMGGVSPGTGVIVNGLERHIDEALENRLRLALGASSGAQVRYSNLSRIESLYNELTETDLSTQLSEFFGGFANLQTDPLEGASRQLVVSNANALIDTLQRQRTGLLEQMDDLNASAENMAVEANRLAGEIADLNARIVTQEAGRNGGASALRDRRDALLRELGTLMDIKVRTHDNGVVNVYVGSEPLVDFNNSRGIRTQVVREDGLERVEVRFADNNGRVVVRDGALGAVIASRDVDVQAQLDKIDSLAKGIIYEVNRVHTSGSGLAGYTQILGTYGVDDAKAALNSTDAGLPFPVQNGSFVVKVRDAQTGVTTSHLVEVDLDGIGDDTSLNDLVEQLNGIPGLTVQLTSDNRLDMRMKAGSEMSFAEDSSGVLAALGVGTFFEGVDATTMKVRAAIEQDPRLIATSLSGATGDGDNAGRLAAVGNRVSDLLGGLSVQDYQESITTNLAVDTAAAQTASDASDAVYSSLLAQREAMSGVSLDEEAINLTKYERSYQGAARFVTVVESLTAEIIGLLG